MLEKILIANRGRQLPNCRVAESHIRYYTAETSHV
jgi:hypothetical protein